jgi:hypothetical protein
MFKLFKKNKAIAVFIISSFILYIHELYRISLGCKRVLGECYIDGANDFYLIHYLSFYLIAICLIIFAWRIIKKIYLYIKPILLRLR